MISPLIDNESSIVVLLVEDEEHHAELICRAIDDCANDFHLTVVTDVRQARAYLINNDPDIVLTDYLLPDGQGIDLLPGKGALQNFPVVLMTSQGNEEIAVNVMKAGAVDYLVKSNDTFFAMPRILLRAVREWRLRLENKRSTAALEIMNQDLAEQVEAHKRTALELSKLFQAVEQSPHMMFITDLDSNIEYVNAKFIEMTGYDKGEVIGQNARILQAPNTSCELYQNMWKTLKAGKVWQDELENRRKDGTVFWAMLSISPIVSVDGDVTHYVAVHEDISERKEAESSMHFAVLQAEIANKTKSELLANMSHELRTPLNAIIGFSSSMQAETFGPLGHDKYREYINDIEDSGRLLLGLISDILDVSAIEAGKMDLNEGPVDLKTLVESSIRLIQYRAVQGDVKICCNLADQMPKFYGDERRMKQILLNILSNAVKFTPPKGTVTLEIHANEVSGFRFTLQDTGVGMDEVELAKAMLPFGQVDRGHNAKHEGTGLGLPLTKGLVELHGGTFEVTSTRGVGTKVRICFKKDRIIVNPEALV